MLELLNINAASYLWVKYPWLMVDKVKKIVPGEFVSASKSFTLNENYCNIMDNCVPESLQIEIFSQLLVITLVTLPDLQGKETREFAWDILFDMPLYIEDEFDIEIEIKSWRRGLARAVCRGYVEGNIVCHGTMDLVVLDVFNQYRIQKKT
jgi:3-hydroxymyristoyl/3-hydroxydecanoyl-(acyl carrier protein) dehydratase